MSRFFNLLWRLECLDREWTLLVILGTWIFPKYAKILTDAAAAFIEAAEVADEVEHVNRALPIYARFVD
jgi:hypothetical protein